MKRPFDLSDPIAFGEGTVTVPGEHHSAVLAISIGRPFCPDPSQVTWYCSYRVQIGGRSVVEASLAGTDGIEAVTNAIVGLVIAVRKLRVDYDVRFYEQTRFAPEDFLSI